MLVLHRVAPTRLRDRVLNVRETAELLRTSERSVRGAIARGEIPAVRIGRVIRVPGAALQRLLDGGGT